MSFSNSITPLKQQLLDWYKNHGFQLTTIPAGSKGPVHDNWNKFPTPYENLADNNNVGLLHGLSNTCCFDIDDETAAQSIPLLVKYILPFLGYRSGKPNRRKIVFTLPAGLELTTHSLPRGAGQFRCGHGHQDVLPPSIHPENPDWIYTWDEGCTIHELPADILGMMRQEHEATVKAKKQKKNKKDTSGYPHIDVYNKWFMANGFNLVDEILKLGGYELVGLRSLRRIGSTNKLSVQIYEDDDGITRAHNFSDTVGSGLLTPECHHDPYDVLTCNIGFDAARKLVCSENKELSTLVDETNSSSLIVSSETPVLDSKCLPGWVGDFVNLATENSEADPLAVLVCLLSTFGTSVAKNHLFIGDKKHHPLMFSCLLGKSGVGRKGTSTAPVDRLFKECMAAGCFGAVPSRSVAFSSGEGILYPIRDASAELKNNNQPVDVGVIDKRANYMDEEFATALDVSKRSGNTLSVNIRKLWDGVSIEPLTKKERLVVTDPLVSIQWHCTPEELLMKFEDSNIHNGFANRILFFNVHRPKIVPIPKKMKLADLKPIISRMKYLITKYTSTTMEIALTKSAEDYWSALYIDLSKELDNQRAMIRGLTGRALPYILRLSLIYSMAEGCDEVHPRHIESGYYLWSCAYSSVKTTFRSKAYTAMQQRVLDYVEKQSDGATLNEITTGPLSNNASASGVVDALVIAGELRMVGKKVFRNE